MQLLHTIRLPAHKRTRRLALHHVRHRPTRQWTPRRRLTPRCQSPSCRPMLHMHSRATHDRSIRLAFNHLSKTAAEPTRHVPVQYVRRAAAHRSLLRGGLLAGRAA
eukprot:7376662-Prymnesium_polylepis.1